MKWINLATGVLLVFNFVSCKTYTFTVDKNDLVTQLNTMDKSTDCVTTKFVLGGGGSETICHNRLRYFLFVNFEGKIDSVFTKNYSNLIIILKNGKKQEINISSALSLDGQIECIKGHKYTFSPVNLDSIAEINFKIIKGNYEKRNYK